MTLHEGATMLGIQTESLAMGILTGTQPGCNGEVVVGSFT